MEKEQIKSQTLMTSIDTQQVKMILHSETRAVNAPYLYSESQKYLPVACNRLPGRHKNAQGKFALSGISLYF